uniref:Uncharacterized protein n=1 Tax=Anguilla anguilla TaxID=7936 RepID=A0A0E9QDP6_ANGAN
MCLHSVGIFHGALLVSQRSMLCHTFVDAPAIQTNFLCLNALLQRFTTHLYGCLYNMENIFWVLGCFYIAANYFGM